MDMEAIVPAPHWRCQANCACSAHDTPTMDVDRILYLDHVKADGCLLFEEIVKMDLGGIVCKRKDSPYKVTDKHSRHWIKIKNSRRYSQLEGREELFECA